MLTTTDIIAIGHAVILTGIYVIVGILSVGCLFDSLAREVG